MPLGTFVVVEFTEEGSVDVHHTWLQMSMCIWLPDEKLITANIHQTWIQQMMTTKKFAKNGRGRETLNPKPLLCGWNECKGLCEKNHAETRLLGIITGKDKRERSVLSRDLSCRLSSAKLYRRTIGV